MARGRGLGRCAAAFWLAALFAAAGLGLLLGGALAADAAFCDLLLYCGGLALLLALAWGVLWRVGNVEVPPAELQDDVGLGGARDDPPPPQQQRRLSRLARSVSRRVDSALGSLSRSSRSTSALALELD